MNYKLTKSPCFVYKEFAFYQFGSVINVRNQIFVKEKFNLSFLGESIGFSFSNNKHF